MKLEEDFDGSLLKLRELGAIQCTQEEAAAVLGVSKTSLWRFFRKYPEAVEAFDRGAFEGRASLRRSQIRMASYNPAMAIWLGKQLLGQRDKADVAVTVTLTDYLDQLPGGA